MNSDEREQGLLKLIADYREQECRRILGEAERRARELRGLAFARQRVALHQSIIAERARAQSLIQAAEAERATRARRRSEQRDAALVSAAWPLLQQALVVRWQAPETRRRWVAWAFDEASRRLPAGGWLVRHPASWSEAELGPVLGAETSAEAGAELASGDDSSGMDVLETAVRPEPPRFMVDDDIVAGLIISASGAELDMSLDGLLRDRARIDARMIALAKQRDPLGSAGQAGRASSGATGGADA